MVTVTSVPVPHRVPIRSLFPPLPPVSFCRAPFTGGLQGTTAKRRLAVMIIELVNTGSELMLGRVLNTHQQWLCRQLADLGYVVSRQVAVPDAGRDIQAAISEALARAELVITTGGLGPTSDDLTRDLIAQMLGRKLKEDPAVLAHITPVSYT